MDLDRIIDRRKSESIKWQGYDKDVLPLWVADLDFAAPDAVIRALHERVEHSVFGYGMDLPELKDTIAAWCGEQYQWKISPDAVVLVPGVVSGFNLAAQSVASAGDGILFHSPAYPPFFSVAENGGFTQHAMELARTNEGAYYPDLELFRSSITPRSKCFLLCNPHNPTGRVFTRDELEGMVEICRQYNLTVISDEIHCDLVFKGSRHIPIASLNTEVENNSITLIAPSKTFNIAGLNASAAIVPNPELRSKIQTGGRGINGGVNLLGQAAALAAYRDGLPWLKAVMEYLEVNRDLVYDFTRAELPGVVMNKPEATFLAWMDCRQAGIKGNPYEFFLEKGRVALFDGSRFGKGGEGFVRLNFGCPRSTLEEALDRMGTALRRR